MTAQFNLQSRPVFVCAAGSTSNLRDPPPVSRLLVRSFICSERRRLGAIFGSPVVRARAAGLAITNTVIRLLNHSGARVIRDTHPRLYRSGGQGCGVQILSFGASVQPSKQSLRRLCVCLSVGENVSLSFAVFVAVLHAQKSRCGVAQNAGILDRRRGFFSQGGTDG